MAKPSTSTLNAPGWWSASSPAAGSTTSACSEAMAEVPASTSCRRRCRQSAYNDSALPIGHEQTISQPWVVATICQAMQLRGDERVLEVGTGSGYSAAVLARLAAHVTSLERVPELAEGRADRARPPGRRERRGGGRRRQLADIPRGAPYDAIAVHAATPEAPHSLLAELATDGRLVVPIAAGSSDLLTAFVRENGDLRQETIGPCRFVPLIGAEGFNPPDRGSK